MHGTIMAYLQRFADTQLNGSATWHSLLTETNLSGRIYLAVETYPDEDVFAIFKAMSRTMERPVPDLLEDFGLFMMPDLMRMYASRVNKEWRTLEFLENLEGTIHRVVRARNRGATPAEIECVRTSSTQAILYYGSARRMCGLARGLLRGVAAHYKQNIRLQEPKCMLTGASRCKFVVDLDAG